MDNSRVFKMTFASVYPHYLTKAEKKGHTKQDVDRIIFWLTGYTQKSLDELLVNKTDFEGFFAKPKCRQN